MQLVTRWRAAATISTNSCMILSGWAGLGWAGRSVSSVSSINMLHGPSAPLSALCVLMSAPLLELQTKVHAKVCNYREGP